MFLTTKALVLRETKYKEADKILTVLTAGEGKLTVKARGALRKSCKYGAAAQALCYSEMVLFGNNGKWSINEAETIEQFLPLRQDIASLVLGRELIVGALLSQVISNVPAAVLLSGFTDGGRALLMGVNIGGLGTPIASLASLISMKIYAASRGADTGKFMKLFLLVNFGLLIVLLAFAMIVMV